MLLAAIVLTSCGSGSKSDEQSSQAIRVKVESVASSDANNLATYSGTVEEENATLVSFAVAGTVRSVNVGLGDRVRKGQLIATLDPQSIQSSYNAAKSTLDQAQDAYNRMQKLHEGGSLPEIKWVEVESKLRQAKSMEEIARKNLSDCRLYAPFDGVVASKEAEVGQNVLPGVAVVKIVTGSRLKVKIAVPESEIASIKIGAKARVTVGALGSSSFEGTVAEKGIVANSLSRSYDVKIRLDAGSKQLMPGMVADVDLQKQAVATATSCALPERIVQIDEKNNKFVWIANGGKAEKRIVTTGDYTPHGVSITSGLNGGDKIIVEGQHKVCEGCAITY